MAEFSSSAPGVYLKEEPGGSPISGVGTARAAFLGLAPQGPTTPTLVTNWTQYVDRFGDLQDGMALGRAVWAYFANGGATCMVVRVGGGDDEAPVAASAALPGADGEDAVIVTARQAGSAGDGISVEVVDLPVATRPGDPEERSAAGDGDGGGDDDGGADRGGAPPPARRGAGASFELVLRDPSGAEERYEAVTPAALVAELERSALATARAPEGRPMGRPAAGRTSLAGGADGAGPSAGAFLGDEQERTGLAGLVTEDEVTMVAAPDLVTALARGVMTTDDVTAVQTALVDHCDKLMDRMAILDPPLSASTPDAASTMNPQEAMAWRDGLTSSKFAATYYPWVHVYDAASRAVLAQPPSGFVAGAWARNDVERGVGVAPTGRLRGAVALARQLTDDDQGPLNERGINCLRVFRGSGPVIWGARTLAQDTEWRYLNVRRLFNYIEESVVEGTKFAVFEPNDTDLWARLRRMVQAFLLGLWRDGALVGATPEEAFYVRCDSETNPDDLVDSGVVTLVIGAAPAKPAEFVVIRIGQSNAGSAISE